MKKWLWLIPAVFVVLILGFVIWAETPSGPMPEAEAAMKSDGEIQVVQNGWITFQPVRQTPDTGLIIYPGGRVDPRSYAPAARQIAAQGYLVVIAPMPLNLAVFNPDRAADIIAAHPEIQSWAIAGHSLGGAMAANYLDSGATPIEGLALWASYPAASDNLVDNPIAVTSISGTLDGLSDPAKIEASRSLLPANTVFVPITGGNHGQFGYYGSQAGDNTATISREEQQAQIVAATLALLEKIR
jgi:Alpha/beta hydrolase family